VIERCFKTQLKTDAWQKKMKTLVPSYGESLITDAKLLKKIRTRTLSTMQLL
jgi:malate dehydrogenase (quinone)